VCNHHSNEFLRACIVDRVVQPKHLNGDGVLMVRNRMYTLPTTELLALSLLLLLLHYLQRGTAICIVCLVSHLASRRPTASICFVGSVMLAAFTLPRSYDASKWYDQLMLDKARKARLISWSTELCWRNTKSSQSVVALDATTSKLGTCFTCTHTHTHNTVNRLHHRTPFASRVSLWFFYSTLGSSYSPLLFC
jgi:hypothetical protein